MLYLRHFLTCCNHEAHLRGNLYIEYETTREALITYHKFNGRWYAGKQLNVNFCNIPSWRAAVCGLFFRNKCPKGNTCNFLHVFRNPGNMYMPSKWSESSNRRNGHTRSSRRTQDRSPSIRYIHLMIYLCIYSNIFAFIQLGDRILK